jgi:cobalt-zinc-cadmium efflux system outer membrane protein
MNLYLRDGVARLQIRGLSLAVIVVVSAAMTSAQISSDRTIAINRVTYGSGTTTSTSLSPVIALYFDPLQGVSSADLVKRALATNGELVAARLDIERARGRLRQAGLRPNPILELEETTGRPTGSRDRDTSVGISIPLEVGGKRKASIELARAELEASEAEIANRERQLSAEVLMQYGEALAALRELQITENLNDLDLQTTRFVQARVNEGDTAPLELNLLRAEIDRLRSRRILLEGRLRVSLLKLKSLVGMTIDEPLRLREDLTAPRLPVVRASLESAVEIAIRTRPDVRLARLTEEVAQAGYRLARAQGAPDIAFTTTYRVERSSFDNTPIGVLTDNDKLITFGVSVGIPVFNRNQGAKTEAAVAVSQARTRREFLEQVVKSEVASAYARYEASRNAVTIFEQGVIARTNENVRAIRAAYELGEFRITDLITEQRRLLDAQREYTETLTEQYRALADLHTAIGAPLTEREK